MEPLLQTVQWSSPNYDYMIVDGQKYMPVNTDGNSVFEIPVKLDTPMQVIGDTVAMSKPHEVEYTLTFHSDSATEVLGEDGESLSYAWKKKIIIYILISIIGLFWLSGCDSPSSDSGMPNRRLMQRHKNGLIYKSSMKLFICKEFFC